jgi:hypothetical protein
MTAALEDFADGQDRLRTYPKPQGHELRFVVREPFQSKRTQCGLVAGRIHADQPLRLESQMPAGSVIFSDGVEADFL